MKRKVSVLTRIFAAVALLVGGLAIATPANASTPVHTSVIVVASPAAAAVSCYGDYCSGQDPEATGCAADAYTATVYNETSASLQERYSPTCQTNWTRLVVYAPGTSCVDSGTLWAVQDTGYTQTAYTSVVCGAGQTFWTPMIYSPVHQVQGRFQSDGFGTPVITTPWA